MGRTKPITLNLSMIFIFHSVIFASIYASPTTDSMVEESNTLCKDLLELAQRIAILETKQSIYTEDRHQLFHYFEVITETVKRQMGIEKENDILKRSLEEMKNELQAVKEKMKEVTNDNIEKMGNTERNLKLEISTLSQQNKENFDNISTVVNEWKNSMEEQITDVAESHSRDNITLSDRIQRVEYDIENEHMINQEQNSQLQTFSSNTMMEPRNNIQETVLSAMDSKFTNFNQSLSDMHQLIQTVNSDVSLLQNRVNGSPVAFYVWLNNENTARKTRIKYDRVVTNVGNAYDENQGSFVTPVKGVYMFAVTVMDKRGPAHLDIMKNREESIGVVRSESNLDSGSKEIILELDIADTVWLRNHVNHGLNSHSGRYAFNTFSGFLIKAT